jgi:predicted NUDIX family NTP pyrophosphohydrolase
MASKQSAGLLMYRFRGGELEVFLAHPGGPFFAAKDDGAWSIPKGEFGPGEEPLAAALREFTEETGFAPAGELIPLGTVRQKSGKVVHAWAFEGDRDDSEAIRSNQFEMEWPPGSGRRLEFPEIDRAAFFAPAAARRKILAAQIPFLERLAAHLGQV